MAGPLADVLFAIAVLATIIAHWYILRSTMRGMRSGQRGARGAWEWVWAFLPAVALAMLFAFTWSAMHPSSITVRVPANRPPVGVGSP